MASEVAKCPLAGEVAFCESKLMAAGWARGWGLGEKGEAIKKHKLLVMSEPW